TGTTNDFAITRTNDSYPADFMSSPATTIPACYFSLSGGGNPILLQNDNEWDMFYLAASDYNYQQELSGNPGHNGQWRLFLMLAKPWNVIDMASSTSTWWGLVNSQHGGGPTFDSWAQLSPALVYQSANLWPVRSLPVGDSLDNKVLTSQYPATQGSSVQDNGL